MVSADDEAPTVTVATVSQLTKMLEQKTEPIGSDEQGPRQVTFLRGVPISHVSALEVINNMNRVSVARGPDNVAVRNGAIVRSN